MVQTSTYNLAIVSIFIFGAVVYAVYINYWFYSKIYSNTMERKAFISLSLVSKGDGTSVSQNIKFPEGFVFDRVNYAKAGNYNTNYSLSGENGNWKINFPNTAAGGSCDGSILLTSYLNNSLSSFVGQNTVTITNDGTGVFGNYSTPCNQQGGKVYIYAVLAGKRV